MTRIGVGVRVEDAFARVRAEFLEMPGLRLTAREVERLCGVEPTICQAVLDALVDAKFLRSGLGGTYARASDGEVARSLAHANRGP